jgi:hypothetical protein
MADELTDDDSTEEPAAAEGVLEERGTSTEELSMERLGGDLKKYS